MVKAGESGETRSVARQMQHKNMTTVDKGAAVCVESGGSKNMEEQKTELAPKISVLSGFLSVSDLVVLRCMLSAAALCIWLLMRLLKSC